jgi:hypothetical protein
VISGKDQNGSLQTAQSLYQCQHGGCGQSALAILVGPRSDKLLDLIYENYNLPKLIEFSKNYAGLMRHTVNTQRQQITCFNSKQRPTQSLRDFGS